MKKIISITLIFVILLTACGTAANSAPENASEDSVSDRELAVTAESSPVIADAEEMPEESSGQSVVYFTSDISPEGLIAVYEALGKSAAGHDAENFLSIFKIDSLGRKLREV